MRKPDLSSAQTANKTQISLPRLAIKTISLFILINLAFAWTNPLPALGRLSAYNVLFPGRLRLPYGEDPSQSYNVSTFNLEAMFASHVVAASKPADEFRVVIIGDSSTWGYLLKPDQTISAYLNDANLVEPDGRKMRFYNLGYPTPSLVKDLLLLNYTMRYKPDLIVWPVTLESFPRDQQLSSPIVQHNPTAVQSIIQTYALNLNPFDPGFIRPGFWQKTLIGQRRDLADLLRLQLYGVMWAATGIDQYYPRKYPLPENDLPADVTFHNLKPPVLNLEDISFDVIRAGFQLAGRVPVLLVNEPILVSNGKNSDIRYNFFYPRWAYDQFRQILSNQSKAHGWHYLDLWDLLPAQEFTNSAIHVTPAGEAEIAQKIEHAIKSMNP